MTRDELHKNYDERIPDSERRMLAHDGYKGYARAFANTAARNFVQRLNNVHVCVCVRRKSGTLPSAVLTHDMTQMRHKPIEAFELGRLLGCDLSL